MNFTKRVGRTIGVMLLLQLTGFIVPFALLHPLTKIDYHTTAAEYSVRTKVALLLFVINCALTIGISIKAWPIFR
jgi:hypothetical protein